MNKIQIQQHISLLESAYDMLGLELAREWSAETEILRAQVQGEIFALEEELNMLEDDDDGVDYDDVLNG